MRGVLDEFVADYTACTAAEDEVKDQPNWPTDPSASDPASQPTMEEAMGAAQETDGGTLTPATPYLGYRHEHEPNEFVPEFGPPRRHVLLSHRSRAVAGARSCHTAVPT